MTHTAEPHTIRVNLIPALLIMAEALMGAGVHTIQDHHFQADLIQLAGLIAGLLME